MHTYRENSGKFEVGYVVANPPTVVNPLGEFVVLFDVGRDVKLAQEWVNYLNGGTGAAFKNSPIPHPLRTR